MRPFAGTLPVTTTQIEVTPAGANVREHESLTIRAVVRRLSDARSPIIHVSADATHWDETPMMPASAVIHAASEQSSGNSAQSV